MTKIMFWNLKQFGTNAVFGAGGKRKRGSCDEDFVYGDVANREDARARLAVVRRVVGDVQPDILSIAEVKIGAAGGAEGSVVADDAAYRLLGVLRTLPGLGQMRLVPPLVLGTAGREGIAVYYNAANLSFVGPWGWPGGLAGPADDIATILGGGGLGGYASPWGGPGGALARALPPGVSPYAGNPLCPWLPAGTQQNRLAGQWLFDDGAPAPNRLEFPLAGNRPPWLTCFVDPNPPPAPGANPRLIKLLSFHAPPDQKPPLAAFGIAAAYAGTAALAGVREMSPATPIGPHEVRCIVGDFNVSAWDDGNDAATFGTLRAHGYIQQLNPRGRATAGAPPVPPIAYGWPQAGYYATHMRSLTPRTPAGGAHPWAVVKAAPVLLGYPGFGWASRNHDPPYGRFDAIDNALTWHGPAAGAAGPLTIANPVTEAPYTLVAAPAGVQTGDLTLAMGSALDDPGVFDVPPPAGVAEDDPDADELYEVFADAGNFCKVQALSDHLPIAIRV